MKLKAGGKRPSGVIFRYIKYEMRSKVGWGIYIYKLKLLCAGGCQEELGGSLVLLSR